MHGHVRDRAVGVVEGMLIAVGGEGQRSGTTATLLGVGGTGEVVEAAVGGAATTDVRVDSTYLYAWVLSSSQ